MLALVEKTRGTARAVAGRKNASHVPSASAASAAAAFGAVGVVYGDIGTSPLYVMRAVFTLDGVSLTEYNLIGVTSAIIWFLVALVTLKYVGVVLRADNRREGGILALSALVRRFVKSPSRLSAGAAVAGIVGASLFFGDSVITPAISVLSAVEGLDVAVPGIATYIVPIALVILTGLFAIQYRGTHQVASYFSPIMALWFALLAVLGAPHIVANPRILLALNPWRAAEFLVGHPTVAFIAMGAIVLSLTGAEALYADLSHFGRRPIQDAWLYLVLPSLVVNYLGQGALLLGDNAALENPFFLLAPTWATIPLVVIATLATLIASQAVITGAFALVNQAIHLNYLPHLRVVYTSEKERGHIYIPAVNLLLYIAVAVIVVTFRSSESLSEAYGLAVTTEFLFTSAMLVMLIRYGWKKPRWVAALAGLVLASIEIPLWTANIVKFFSGGWLPVSIAIVLSTIMLSWKTTSQAVYRQRTEQELPLAEYFDEVAKKPVHWRIPGTAIYPHSLFTSTPRPLLINTKFNDAIHERVVILAVKTVALAHVPPEQRVKNSPIACPLPGFFHLTVTYGFMDSRDPIADLELYTKRLREAPEPTPANVPDFSVEDAMVFAHHLQIEQAPHHGKFPNIFRWLFVQLSRFSASPRWLRKMPVGRTVEYTTRIYV